MSEWDGLEIGVMFRYKDADMGFRSKGTSSDIGFIREFLSKLDNAFFHNVNYLSDGNIEYMMALCIYLHGELEYLESEPTDRKG